jgi:hypothetical protein
MIAEPAAPCGRDPFAPLQFAHRPGNGMASANCSESSPMVVAAMVTPFVMAPAPVPSVVMAAAAVSMAMMAVSVPAPDLDHGAILRGQRRDAKPGGSGQGHCQRGNQCRADQNDTSHAGVLPIAESRCLTQVPDPGFCSMGPARIADSCRHSPPRAPVSPCRAPAPGRVAKSCMEISGKSGNVGFR